MRSLRLVCWQSARGGRAEAECAVEALCLTQGREADDWSQGDGSRSGEQRLDSVTFEGKSDRDCPRTGRGVLKKS